MPSNPGRTIAAECFQVASAFDQLLSRLADPPSDSFELSLLTVRDEKGRFHVWAGNIGALQSPASVASLDSRLRDAPQIRDQILRILARLIQSIQKTASIASGESPNRVDVLDIDELQISDSDEDDLSPVSDDDMSLLPTAPQISEIAQLRKAINDTITNLFKLSMAIRKPTPRGRYAASKSLRPFDALYDVAHVQHKFPLISDQPWLVERLGKAITRRREYFRYRREHRAKLERQVSRAEEETQEEARSTGHSVRQELTTTRSQAEQHGEGAPTVAHTKATTFLASPLSEKLLREQEEAASLTSYATSVEENSPHALGVPEPPQSTRGVPFEYGAPFECPYCFTIQMVRGMREWKRHVFRDLQPYMCTFKDCGSQLFAERHAWFQHELFAHRKEWRCNLCRHKPFDTARGLEEHFRNRHAGSFAEAQLFGVVQLCETTHDRFPASACPFCDDWKLHSLPGVPTDTTVYATVAQFRRHLGKHLEQLALFALPKASNDNASDDDADSNDAIADKDATTLSSLPDWIETDQAHAAAPTLQPQPESTHSSTESIGAMSDKERQFEFVKQFKANSQAEKQKDQPDKATNEARAKAFDEAMLAWIPTSSMDARKPFGEPEFKGISTVLRQFGRDSWSHNPKIYALLHIINEVRAMEDFLSQGYSDAWLPFSHRNLETLRPRAMKDFLDAQHLVLNPNSCSEELGEHCSFSSPDVVPFQEIALLGVGGFAEVDKVFSSISLKQYARKRMRRGLGGMMERVHLEVFERELSTLRKLSHRHIVKAISSYTDSSYVAIIMSPVTDCTLADFLLSNHSPGDRAFLQTLFGCLTSTVAYLHESHIRHNGIKPSNILIKSRQVFLTDFGESYDWSNMGDDTTHVPIARTLRYCAPEVAESQAIDSSADIWSLGCVFLEVWTALIGKSVYDLHAHLDSSGSGSRDYHSNYEAIFPWCDLLMSSSDSSRWRELHSWIMSMLEHKPGDRWTARALLDRIQETSTDPQTDVEFMGHCCIEAAEYSGEESSDFKHDVTKASSSPYQRPSMDPPRASQKMPEHLASLSTRPDTQVQERGGAEAGNSRACESLRCKHLDLRIWYCSHCAMYLCDDCWGQLPIHEPGRVDLNGEPHQKVDPDGLVDRSGNTSGEADAELPESSTGVAHRSDAASASPEKLLSSGATADVPDTSDIPRRGRMVYSFGADSADELTVSAGDEVLVLGDVARGDWWKKVRSSSGAEGLVPAAYVAMRKRGIILHDYVGRSSGEVTVSRGDEVLILNDTASDQWWKVRVVKDGTEGMVPAGYVEVE